MPASQGTQFVEPWKGEMSPIGHGAHVALLVAPVALLAVPGGHGVHDDEPTALQLPGAHSWHVDEPAELQVPAAHVAQSVTVVDPLDGLAVPGGHAMHSDDPNELQLPGAHTAVKLSEKLASTVAEFVLSSTIMSACLPSMKKGGGVVAPRKFDELFSTRTVRRDELRLM